MNTIEKFISDIQKTIKYDRANNGGHYDGRRACGQITRIFQNNNRNLGTLAMEVGDYWLNTYILSSQNANEEPTEENIARIKAFQCFFDNDNSEDLDILSSEDFESLRDCINDNAEEINLDDLQNMMSILLDRGAI